MARRDGSAHRASNPGAAETSQAGSTLRGMVLNDNLGSRSGRGAPRSRVTSPGGRHRPRVVRVRRLVVAARSAAALVTVAALFVAVAALPAMGHASTQIPHARWSLDGDLVRMHFTAAADDLADTVVAAGRWDEDVMWAYVDGDLEALPDEAEIAALAADEDLRRYLLDHVRVEVAGETCPAELTLPDDYIAQGASYTFSCPPGLDEARITITLLHGQNAAYRVFSVDGTEQYAAHTAAAPTHTFDLQAASAPALGSLFAMGSALLAILLVSVFGVVRWQRRTPRP